MQPHQLTLIYLLYGRIEGLKLIANYYIKMNYPPQNICTELLIANKQFNKIKESLYAI